MEKYFIIFNEFSSFFKLDLTHRHDEIYDSHGGEYVTNIDLIDIIFSLQFSKGYA